MTRFSLTATAAAALLALSLPAGAATTFNVTYNGAGPTVGVSGGIQGGTQIGPNSLAGAIKATASGANAPDELTSQFIAWCLDIGSTMKTWTYSVTDVPFIGHDLSGVMGTIQNLFNTAYTVAKGGTADQSAGFQLALWEILYEDTGSYNVSNGKFQVSSTAGAITAANGFLGGLNGVTTGNYKLTYLQAEPGQNKSQHLVTAQLAPPVSEVPLPAAGLLLFGALGGLGVVARRRKSADA